MNWGAGAKEYTHWLSENLRAGAERCVLQNDVEAMRWLAEEFASEDRQMELLLDTAKRREAPELVSLLMDVKRRRFPGKKKKFSL